MRRREKAMVSTPKPGRKYTGTREINSIVRKRKTRGATLDNHFVALNLYYDFYFAVVDFVFDF